MIILTTTYNCQSFIERCLFSIMGQTYKNFTCYITDDLSNDSTKEIIKKTVLNDKRFVLIENQTKLFQPGNYDQVLRTGNLDEDEICIEVDGDDYLPHSKVFENIFKIYEDSDVWMTSGSFRYHDNRPGFARPPMTYENIRKQAFTLSHIRTWKKWLWNKIEQKDLKDDDGKYYSVAGDLAFMFPMFEMSGEKHYRFISEVNYIYNESNPLNDHKVNMDLVVKTVNKIRNKNPYKLL
jgi:glycosyltransferase involved in cell wall biosynthesis